MRKISKKFMAVLLSVLMATSFTAIPFTSFAKDSSEKNYAEGEAIVVLNENADKTYLGVLDEKRNIYC